ncbi:MAG TPA: hypothetical protein PLZ51_09305, partial [Aggregatilineales bacterium]|nr:hypothetical protein [Aggregatilineales bacterium]
LIAYTWGGLWQISPRAEWSLLASDAPTGGEAHGVGVGQDGRIFITSQDALHIFSAQGERISQISLPKPLTGVVSIHQYDDILFIVSGDGELIALREDGLICGQLRIYGGESDNHHWQAMGTDGTLRLRVGYLTMGLDWSQFIRGC